MPALSQLIKRQDEEEDATLMESIMTENVSNVIQMTHRGFRHSDNQDERIQKTLKNHTFLDLEPVGNPN
jgi:hypothetical protein